MIKCFELNSQFYKDGIEFENFSEIKNHLKHANEELHKFPVEAILLIINEFSKKIALNKEILRAEGVPFLCFYFKKVNMEKQVTLNLGDMKYLDNFLEVEKGKFMKAQGRGIVCHWTAGNVPTLGIYSVIESLLCKNANILRVPENSITIVYELLKLLDDIAIELEGITYSSKVLLRNIVLIYFNSENHKLNSKMSLAADARVIWGGKEAVDSISLLPKKTTCKDLVFGPKYSFAVFHKSAIKSLYFEKYLEKLVMDIITFNQMACSSPQVVFIEKTNLSINEIGETLSKVFEKVLKRYKSFTIEEAIAAKIINKRGEYLLSLDKMIYKSKGLEYTILINSEKCLEEPIFGRTIFLKEVDNILEAVALVTNKVQTIGIASEDVEKTIKFAEKVTAHGVDRVTNIGHMNYYDSPWDGSLIISELVRWCSLNIK
ncbi:acyl-CoA reductase (LuxC) [Clostridium homopropionicum DSM 5847]|uniref:Acyl-CoA reductase (LuxC) n=1 Tax=Clostridium homopropionicum DSM 5847 TaxID=1121318 RepID=A0A0L6ZC46_9CLOT|nr:acyl-CoA reductase [Clostridium homopropionicum]KOA20363.1 acyl-CoA reductase (LuxC) [Clostridium homopropionicum DSM 5847]SFG74175.1 Acyl-CoA reductase (LuxC) [Clostridium homopropionicum]